MESIVEFEREDRPKLPSHIFLKGCTIYRRQGVSNFVGELIILSHRPKTKWSGGIDCHHIFFEGLHHVEGKGYRIFWGS
jgi:hypothetical protein